MKQKTGGRTRRGVSKGREFLLASVACDTKACLIWPFARNRATGYGSFGYLGGNHYAHRYMCQLVNGAPPSPTHEAAHSCGQGHMGCVHPGHLSWKSIAENVQDSWNHTPTPRNSHGCQGRLVRSEVEQIRQLKGTMTQAAIAQKFGISAATVRDIYLGRSHRDNPKIKVFSDDEDDKLRSLLQRKLTIGEIASQMNRTRGSVWARIYRKNMASPV